MIRLRSERIAGVDAVRTIERVDVAPTIIFVGGRVASVKREDCLKLALNR